MGLGGAPEYGHRGGGTIKISPLGFRFQGPGLSLPVFKWDNHLSHPCQVSRGLGGALTAHSVLVPHGSSPRATGEEAEATEIQGRASGHSPLGAVGWGNTDGLRGLAGVISRGFKVT